MSPLIAAVTLSSSMLAISRAPVPAIFAKLSSRRDPSAARNDSEPWFLFELSAVSAIADSSGTVSSGLPISD